VKVGDKHFRTIWICPTDRRVVQVIDQRFLPHKFVIEDIKSVSQMADAIREMHVRGAGLIGAAAGYGMYLAALEAEQIGDAAEFDRHLAEAAALLKSTRPTAVNLTWAIERQLATMADAGSRKTEDGGQRTARAGSERGMENSGTTRRSSLQLKSERALQEAEQIADEDAQNCRLIGRHGLELIEHIAQKKNGKPVNVLTHCNAGWLAFVDHGSALAPVYAAHDRQLPVHVWVDETRPRNQGAKLTAWELSQHGVPHTIITDNAGGHLMQRGDVDLVIVGSDRTTRAGDVANKIGTYLKALAARDMQVPFYVALPSSSIDWTIREGSEIPIEQRGAEEVKRADGSYNGEVVEVSVAPESSPAANYAFDVTPRRLVTGLITERGICRADEKSILELFPEHRP
jgi:methylthioribose-1-phosphate isomerase